MCVHCGRWTLLSDLHTIPTLRNKIATHEPWLARRDVWAKQAGQDVHSKLCGKGNGGAVGLVGRQHLSGGEVTQHSKGCKRPWLGGAAGLQQIGKPICSNRTTILCDAACLEGRFHLSGLG